MTIGVGGSSAEKELAAMKNMRGAVRPIGVEERLQRIARAQAIMREKGIDALYLDVSSSMTYFTGLNFRRTERMHSAVLPAKGDIVYISPAFEVEKLKTMTSFGDKIEVWEEDDDPTAVVTETVRSLGYPKGVIAVGEATAYPHGVPYPQTLKEGDMVLIDTGAPVDGYFSDITRSYVFGEPTKRQRDVWNLEKAAQAAAFAAAKPGNKCEDIDAAARGVIAGGGFGPGYATPGLPHRTGHGVGLDVHEWPYLVK